MLSDSSFEEVELSTIITVFEQDALNIESELELFNGLSKYANRNNQNPGAKVPRLDGIGNCAFFLLMFLV